MILKQFWKMQIDLEAVLENADWSWSSSEKWRSILETIFILYSHIESTKDQSKSHLFQNLKNQRHASIKTYHKDHSSYKANASTRLQVAKYTTDLNYSKACTRNRKACTQGWHTDTNHRSTRLVHHKPEDQSWIDLLMQQINLVFGRIYPTTLLWQLVPFQQPHELS